MTSQVEAKAHDLSSSFEDDPMKEPLAKFDDNLSSIEDEAIKGKLPIQQQFEEMDDDENEDLSEMNEMEMTIHR